MHKFFLITLLFVFGKFVSAQELQATVVVNAERMTDVNPQIFKNLQTKVNELLNNTNWSNEKYLPQEKIECNFFFNVSEFNMNTNVVVATLQVQASRPVYNSTYSSPLININDNHVSFKFLEFEQLIYDQNSFTSNLVSLVAFYANIIIGLDKDSYSELSGTKYLTTASNIMTLAQTSGYKGWSQNEGNNNNRYFIISDLNSNTYLPYRKAIYEYHYKGLDIMNEDLKKGKEEVFNAIKTLSALQSIRPNALLTRMFFDAKTDEIVSIFSGGPRVNVVPLIETLNRISPLNSQKWSKIK
mgnify:CR=1 FL=1